MMALLYLAHHGGTQTYNGGLNTASVDGTVTLNGTITTSNDAVVLGVVTLGSATTVDTNATANMQQTLPLQRLLVALIT